MIDGHSVNCRAVPVGNLYKPTTLILCWWQNIIDNLYVVYKLRNAQILPDACLLRQIGTQPSLIVPYRFFPFTNTQTIATHQSNPPDIFKIFHER